MVAYDSVDCDLWRCDGGCKSVLYWASSVSPIWNSSLWFAAAGLVKGKLLKDARLAD